MQLIESRYAPRLRQPSHVHESALVAMVVAGDLSEERDGHARSRGAPGEIVVVPRGAAHDVAYGARGAKLLTLELDADVGRYRWLIGGAPSALFVRAIDEWRSGARIDDLVTDLVAAIRELPGERDRGGRERTMLRELARRLPESGVTVADAAREIGMHPVALARAFRRELGCSITCYRRREQLRRAAAMLSETRMSLSDVALEAGFADQSHFCRIFKREIGLAPSAYRALTV